MRSCGIRRPLLFAAILAATLLQPISVSAETNGLVAAWSFNEGSGATVADSSGLNHTGTISGAVWTASGRYGNGLSFNGTNAMVTVPDSPALDLSTGMTLMAWVNSTTATGVRDVIIKEGPGSDFYNVYYRNWRGQPEANVLIGGSNRVAEGTALAANTWIHVAGTYDGATLRLFINGAQVKSTAVTGAIPASTGLLRIGGNSLWGEFFQGVIDEVRVYNRALTASEIQVDMSTPIEGSSNLPTPSEIGQWAAPVNWPLVTVHMALLRTGRVLAWDANPTVPLQLWDPATGSLTQTGSPFTNIFCTGHTVLPDGRLAVVGGHSDAHVGLPDLNFFDPITRTWSAAQSMSFARWYPTATTLPDGRMLVMSGEVDCFGCETDVPEIYDPTSGLWEVLTNARRYLPFYPHMYVLPDGRLLAASSAKSAMATYILDLTTRTWTTLDPAVIDGGSSVMYLPGKIMKSGTSANSDPPYWASARTTYVLDALVPTPRWRQTAPMSAARAYHNLIVLPDGNVLAVGGGGSTDVTDLASAVLQAELWSPVSETWTLMASMDVPRLYHSTALLLPDGRVLVSGSGRWGFDQLSAQVYSPPYLFKGARPIITGAPATISHGSNFIVSTPDAARIAKVSLIRPGSVTHAFDQDQRFVPLTFQTISGGVSVQAPTNANSAPPGFYLLFIVDNDGVPSVGTFVQLPMPGGDVQPPTAPSGLNAAGAVRAVSLSWNAATDNIGVTGYNVHRATSSGFLPTTGNRIATTTGTAYADSNLAAGTYYYVVTAKDAAGNVSAPSPQASATALPDTSPPAIAITAPSAASTVSGTVMLTAAVSDNVAVSTVQFLLDGVALGAPLSGPPYSTSWVTSGVSNGSHTLSARATDSSGNVGLAPEVTVTVSNTGPSGAVAAYAFNEASGTTAADASGNGHPGSVSGATWIATGKFGRALSFDGVNDWVTVPNSPDLNVTTGLTIMAWIYPTVSNGVRDVVIKEGAGVDVYNLYHRNWRGRPEANIFVGGVNRTAEGTSLPANTWSHIASTYDGTTLRLFVNGAQAASTAASGALPVSSAPLRIGGNALWGEFFKGRIDEIRVYNRALSQAEIQSLMNTPLP
jgi:hypothetical protein